MDEHEAGADSPSRTAATPLAAVTNVATPVTASGEGTEKATSQTPATANAAPKVEGASVHDPATAQASAPHAALDEIDAVAAPEVVAETAAPPVNRFMLLAALLALAAALGATLGALAGSGLSSSGPAPAVAAGQTGLEEVHALKENVVQARVELAALKTTVDGGHRNASTQFARIGERIERLERIQAEPAVKLNKAIDLLDRLARDVTGQPKEVTGSIAVQPIAGRTNQLEKPGSIDRWVVRDVRRGTALIEGRMGLIEVDPGDVVPGLGRVAAIRKQDGRWVVITSKGLITSAR